MKTQIIAFLKENIGKGSGEHLAGFGGWLNGKLMTISDTGDIELEFEIREEMLNPMGTIHGGALASIMDEAMGMQLFVKSGEEEAFFAMNIAVDFVKNAKFGEKLLAKPEIIRIGRNTANLRCSVYNAAGEVAAHGSSNFLKVKG
jgi:uncharacterized protein (TIGR00369 family)